MNNHTTMQVRLVDFAAMPLEKLYAAFRTCYSSDTPIEIWEKIEAQKIGHEKIREFIGERLKTGHSSPLEQVVFWFGIATSRARCRISSSAIASASASSSRASAT